MDKVGRSLKTAGNAFEELEGTRKRQLERELDKIETVRRRQASDGEAAALPGEPAGTGDAVVMPLALEA